MKRKWYRKEDLDVKDTQNFHCWGENIGMGIAVWHKGLWWDDEDCDINARYTHFMPFPNEPRPHRR
jgi:hypothetical protein